MRRHLITEIRKTCIILLISVILSGCGATGQTSDIASDRESYIPAIPSDEKLNPQEQELDKALSRMKEEAAALYDEDEPFGTIRYDDEDALTSDLYAFCHALPKGAELHAHEQTLIDFDRYLDLIRSEAMICTDEGDDYGHMYAVNSSDIPDSAQLLDDVLKNGDMTEDEFRALLTVDEEDMEDEEAGFWNTLTNSFIITRGLSTDTALTQKIYEEGFRCACEKGILLLELRVSCKPDDELNISNLSIIRDAYYDVRNEYPDFRVRIIGCAGKSAKYTVEDSCNALRSVIAVSKNLKDEYDPSHPEELIIGLDLVNEEDKGKPLETYMDFLTSDEVRSSGLKLYLHCGESLRLDNESVVDAYMAHSDRVGHGFNLYRYPELMEKYKEQDITLEVCPISNLRLGYVHDLRLHPALLYLRECVPVVICSDDGLFMTPEPLTDDYYAAILCWDLNLSNIKDICRRSIEDSGLSESEKQTLMNAWERDWDAFVTSCQ